MRIINRGRNYVDRPNCFLSVTFPHENDSMGEWVNPLPTHPPGMLEETPEGVPNPRHPQTQDCHRKGAEGGVRGLFPKGEHFRIFLSENLWRETNFASCFRGFIIANYF